ncbi:MAG: nicotinate-nucleotide adenylyltransferase [Nitriliruptorales bacterium]|nr:nicotinate-nucleotide adenylyltransferase [Nitriliruptorales bacterium]
MSSTDGRRRVGLLGGTFDPPHIGHLVAAEEARVALGLEEVRFLVAGDPWMKDQTGTSAQRVDMAELAVAGNDGLSVDSREIRREGPTYTADTLKELRQEEPGADWVFLVGADAAAHIAEWERVEDALAMAEFVAMTRPGYSFDRSGPLTSRVGVIEVPAVGVSSTDLRRRFAEGRAVRYQLPRSVERYVREHGLYGAAHER